MEGAKKARELLVRQRVSVIIGHMLSTQCLEALAELNRWGVPLVSPVASSPLLSGKRDLFFRLRPDATAPATHLAKHLISRGLLRAGILYDTKNPGYTEPWVDAFAQATESFGGNILFNTGFSSLDDGADVSLVQTVLEKEPDALLLVASAQETARLIVSLARLKVTFPLFGVGWAQTDRLITEAGSAAQYLVLATNDPPVEEAPGAVEFVRFYKKRFGTLPNFAAVRAYDTVRFLVHALESVAGRPERLREALGQPREFDSLSGRLFMDPYGDVHAESYLMGVRERAGL